MPVTVAVPVKRFYVAKRRLAPSLSAAHRSRLGRDLAAHTLGVVTAAGADPLVLAADDEVAKWAAEFGWPSRVDAPSDGLDGAAATVAATGSPWIVLHADLPLLAPSDLTAALDALAGGEDPIAPSNDGGTSLIGSHRPVRLTYGLGSFHRHLPRLAAPRVLVRTGLALDLDDPSDLVAATAHPRGRWLRRYPRRE